MSTRLVPITLLADSDTIAAFQPSIDDAVKRLEQRGDIVLDLMAQRGWTAEMIAWASVLAALGRSLAAGEIRLDVNTIIGGRSNPDDSTA